MNLDDQVLETPLDIPEYMGMTEAKGEREMGPGIITVSRKDLVCQPVRASSGKAGSM